MKEQLKPLMRKGEIKVIEKQLLALGNLGRKISILEWGSGGSTVYFTDFLKNNEIDYDWTSIEYNKNWCREISNRSKDDNDIQIVLFDVGNDNIRQRFVDMTEYVKYPSTLNKYFDFVLVDGRKRRLCLIESQKFVSNDGAVFLHDANRKYYHCATRNYSDSFFVTAHLWRGSNKQVSFFRKIFTMIVYYFWRVINFIEYKIVNVLRFFYHKIPFLKVMRESIKNENI